MTNTLRTANFFSSSSDETFTVSFSVYAPEGLGPSEIDVEDVTRAGVSLDAEAFDAVLVDAERAARETL